MIELQIAGNISRHVNIHGQICLPRRVLAMSDEISSQYIDRYIKTNLMRIFQTSITKENEF